MLRYNNTIILIMKNTWYNFKIDLDWYITMYYALKSSTSVWNNSIKMYFYNSFEFPKCNLKTKKLIYLFNNIIFEIIL